MANIHRIGDYQNNNPGPGNYMAYGQNNMNMPFFATSRKDPRQENVLDFMKYSCCPNLRLYSFTVIITIIDIIMYAVSIGLGGLCIPSNSFLQPNPCTLETLGAQNSYLQQQNFQIWRFITPVFLHFFFLHIFLNVCSQLIIGSMMEKLIGTQNLIILYFLSAIGGNLLSSITMPNVISAGASTAIVGMIGIFIAYIVINWRHIPPALKTLIVCLIVLVLFMLIITFLGSGTSIGGSDSEESSPITQGENVNGWAHLGGGLTGLFFGLALIKPMKLSPDGYEKRMKFIGFGLGIVGFITGFTVFYTMKVMPLYCSPAACDQYFGMKIDFYF